MSSRRLTLNESLSRRPRLLWLLEVPGGILLVLGWLGDRSGLWEKYGFIGNVVSGFTTAIIGAPFAFFIVQGLLRKVQQERDTVRLTRLVTSNLAEISGTLLPLCRSVEPALLQSAAASHIARLRGVAAWQAEADGVSSESSVTDWTPEEIRAADDVRNSLIEWLDGTFRLATAPDWIQIGYRWSEIASALILLWPVELINKYARSSLQEVIQGPNPYETARAEFSSIERMSDLFAQLARGDLGTNALSTVECELSAIRQIMVLFDRLIWLRRITSNRVRSGEVSLSDAQLSWSDIEHVRDS